MEENNTQRGRYRKKVVAFRVSEEEDILIERYVNLSGLSKQEYILRKLTDKKIEAVGSVRLFNNLKSELAEILEELKRITKVNPENEYVLELLATCLKIIATIEENQNMAEKRKAYERDKRGGWSNV